jgi:hypothetical protein
MVSSLAWKRWVANHAILAKRWYYAWCQVRTVRRVLENLAVEELD